MKGQKQIPVRVSVSPSLYHSETQVHPSICQLEFGTAPPSVRSTKQPEKQKPPSQAQGPVSQAQTQAPDPRPKSTPQTHAPNPRPKSPPLPKNKGHPWQGLCVTYSRIFNIAMSGFIPALLRSEWRNSWVRKELYQFPRRKRKASWPL